MFGHFRFAVIMVKACIITGGDAAEWRGIACQISCSHQVFTMEHMDCYPDLNSPRGQSGTAKEEQLAIPWQTIWKTDIWQRFVVCFYLCKRVGKDGYLRAFKSCIFTLGSSWPFSCFIFIFNCHMWWTQQFWIRVFAEKELSTWEKSLRSLDLAFLSLSARNNEQLILST